MYMYEYIFVSVLIMMNIKAASTFSINIWADIYCSVFAFDHRFVDIPFRQCALYKQAQARPANVEYDHHCYVVAVVIAAVVAVSIIPPYLMLSRSYILRTHINN